MSYIGQGVIRCEAYPEGYVPDNVEEVVFSGTLGVLQEEWEGDVYPYHNGTSLVSLFGIAPLSTHEVYCVSTSLTGVHLRYRHVVLTRMTLTTIGKKQIVVSLATAEVIMAAPYPEFLSISMSSSSDTALTISLDVLCTSTPTDVLFNPSTVLINAGRRIDRLPVTYTGVGPATDCSLDVSLSGNNAADFEVALNCS